MNTLFWLLNLQILIFEIIMYNYDLIFIGIALLNSRLKWGGFYQDGVGAIN